MCVSRSTHCIPIGLCELPVTTVIVCWLILLCAVCFDVFFANCCSKGCLVFLSSYGFLLIIGIKHINLQLIVYKTYVVYVTCVSGILRFLSPSVNVVGWLCFRYGLVTSSKECIIT